MIVKELQEMLEKESQNAVVVITTGSGGSIEAGEIEQGKYSQGQSTHRDNAFRPDRWISRDFNPDGFNPGRAVKAVRIL